MHDCIKLAIDNAQIGNTIIFELGSERYMKLDIPYYIRQVLREKRMVTVPGIGTLKLEQTSASFNEDKTIISPPFLNIGFDETESNDQSLLKYILDTGLMSEEKARKKIDLFTQSAFNQLLNLDSFLISGIGTLTKNKDDDEVDFEPNFAEFTKEFQGLKPISIVPISRIVEQNNLAASSPSIAPVEESRSILPRIILLSLFLIALYFLGRHFYKTYFSDPDQKEIGVDEDKDETADLTFDQSNQDELEQKYEEIDELIDPLGEKNKIEQGNNTKLNEELVNLSQKEEKDISAEEDEGMGGANLESGTSQDNIETGVSSEESKTNGSTKSDIIENPLNKHASIIPESGECIIIVGSFIKSLNTIKMISLLERKGYKVHQSEYKGFARVGILYECEDEDLESYLQDIRKKISSKAWYLDPELEVPYLR